MRPYDHKKIEQEEIVERYVMRQLSEEEEAAFEEHFFGCDECFEKVKFTEKAIAGIRAAAKEGLLEEKSRGVLRLVWDRTEQFLTQPAIAVAAAVLVLLLIYPALRGIFITPKLQHQLEALNTPQPINHSFSLEEIQQRSAEDIWRGEILSEMKVQLPRDAEYFTLNFTILENSIPNPTYRAEILTRENKVIWATGNLTSIGEFGVFSILCPRSFFSPGKYLLRVEELDRQGHSTGKVHLFPFEVVLE